MTEMFDSYTQARFVDAAIEQQITAAAQRAPHVLLHPRIFPDGNAWCALLGEDLQSGVVGFGDTPAAAAAEFDRNWSTQRAPGAKGGCGMRVVRAGASPAQAAQPYDTRQFSSLGNQAHGFGGVAPTGGNDGVNGIQYTSWCDRRSRGIPCDKCNAAGVPPSSGEGVSQEPLVFPSMDPQRQREIDAAKKESDHD